MTWPGKKIDHGWIEDGMEGLEMEGLEMAWMD